MTTILFPLLLAISQATPAPAATPACATRDTALPAELAGWTTTGTGTGLDRSLQLAVRNGAASVTFTVGAAGRYRVALDQPGWIDVVAGGRALESTAHGHGPDCSTIRKLVGFDLQPGTYTLRLTRLAGDKARAMIVSPRAAS